MKRRTFTGLAALGLVASSLPISFIREKGSILPDNELIGKGEPDLTETARYRLRPAAATAYERMKVAAAGDGIRFQEVSSYRDYDHQNRIWERKFKRFKRQGLSTVQSIEKIIEYSTIPGTSRHHWGTDIDIVDGAAAVQGDLLVPSKFHGKGPFCKFKEWMDAHANAYGFYLVYTDTYARKGFNYEPWHYSYKDLSISYLAQYQKLDIKHLLQTEQLMGSNAFSEEFIDRYLAENVMDINPDLIP